MAARRRSFAILAVVLFAATACAQNIPTAEDAEKEALRSGSPGISLNDEIRRSREGNSLTIPVSVGGMDIVPPDGDTSGETGHFHVFIDRDPVAVGEAIPREEGIVHTADNPIKIFGIPPGEHTITVVVGDGTHVRIHDEIELEFTVEFEGPHVAATAPATIDEGDDLEITFDVEGIEIVPADGDDSGETGHIHVIVDPIEAPEEGKPIPEAVENEIIHTTEDSVTIEGLDAGTHDIWVVVGDGRHIALDPAVIDRLSVTVG